VSFSVVVVTCPSFLCSAYFYIATAYDGTFDCCDEAGVDAAHLKPWEEDTLRTWHNLDPVSDEERTRNDDIYTMFQKNRCVRACVRVCVGVCAHITTATHSLTTHRGWRRLMSSKLAPA
jgi:hypothetical protein